MLLIIKLCLQARQYLSAEWLTRLKSGAKIQNNS